MTAGITGQFAGSQQVGAARFCGLARLMCSPALRQGPSLNPQRHLGISLRAVPFSLVLCLTNSSPFSGLEVHSLSPWRKRLQLHLDSPHPELQQECSVAESWGGCWVHLMFLLSLKDDSHGLPIVQCLERRALYILFLKWEAKSQTKGQKLKFGLHVCIFQFFCDYFWGMYLFSSLFSQLP